MKLWMAIGSAMLLLAACSSRPVGVGAGGEESGEGEGDGETGIPTSSTSTDSGTSTPGDGSATSPGTSSTTGDVKFDLAGVPDVEDPVPEVFPCKLAFEGTSIAGNPPLGAFSGTEAWFAGDSDYVRLVIFDESADTEAEGLYAGMYNGSLDEGPALVVEIDVFGMLPKTEALPIQHYVDGDEAYFMGEVTVDDLLLDDFNAPHTLLGSITLWPDQNADGVTGSFTAGYCQNYEQIFWGE